jgi:dienelactone hydrolase
MLHRRPERSAPQVTADLSGRRPVKFLAGWLLFLVLVATPSDLSADTFAIEKLRIPAPGAGDRGLEALLVRPPLPGRLPLVLISHGSPGSAELRSTMTPQRSIPPAMEFARRGWAVAIVMRRGYGDSGGRYSEASGKCASPDYVTSGVTASADLRASIEHLRSRPDIDGSRLLAIGQSAGGLATIALTADPPRGLLAGINFSGGQIAVNAGERCKGTEDRLVAAFAHFGKRSRVPMLWIYSENDQLFPAELVQRFHDAFSGAGGNVQLIKEPPFGDDGHAFFSGGMSKWISYVDEFLKERKLVLLESPLPPPPPPAIAPPPRLTEAGRKSFENFLKSPPHRAFAISPKGALSWRSGYRSADDATNAAMEGCKKFGTDCALYVVDDKMTPLPPPPDISPPGQLSVEGKKSFDRFLQSPPHRAFALSPGGAYGWHSGGRTIEEASKLALEGCLKHAVDCEIVVLDDKAIR